MGTSRPKDPPGRGTPCECRDRKRLQRAHLPLTAPPPLSARVSTRFSEVSPGCPRPWPVAAPTREGSPASTSRSNGAPFGSRQGRRSQVFGNGTSVRTVRGGVGRVGLRREHCSAQLKLCAVHDSQPPGGPAQSREPRLPCGCTESPTRGLRAQHPNPTSTRSPLLVVTGRRRPWSRRAPARSPREPVATAAASGSTVSRCVR